MNEQEWLACTDPDRLLHSTPTGVDEYRLALYARACARRAWWLVTDPADQGALARLDRLPGPSQPSRAWLPVVPALVAVGLALARTPALGPGRAAHYNTEPSFFTAVYDVVIIARVARVAAQTRPGRTAKTLRSKERRAQREILRDVFGNPFRRLKLDPAWRTPDVQALAQAVHDNPSGADGGLDRFRFRVLGDALEEAGCTNRVLLDHCRSHPRHVPGCHLLDLLVRRE
jgi:hypothetical protein